MTCAHCGKSNMAVIVMNGSGNPSCGSAECLAKAFAEVTVARDPGCECEGYCNFHGQGLTNGQQETQCPNTNCKLECDCQTIACEGSKR